MFLKRRLTLGLMEFPNLLPLSSLQITFCKAFYTFGNRPNLPYNMAALTYSDFVREGYILNKTKSTVARVRPTNSGKRSYTVKKIQGFLGISRATAYKLVNSDRFHAVKVGRQLRVQGICHLPDFIHHATIMIGKDATSFQP